MIKKNLRRTVSLLISAFLTTGLLYAGIPVSAENIAVPDETSGWTESEELPEQYAAWDDERPEGPTGWFEEIPDPDGGQALITDASDTSGELSIQGAELTEEEVYRSLVNMRTVYPEGMHYTNDDSYSPYYHYENGRKITYTGYGCAAFAFHLSNVAFGSLPDREHTDWDDIRVGDILRLYTWGSSGHSVIVLSASGDDITVAEGNYNSSIHWGRVIKRSYLKANGVGIWTRWAAGSGGTTVTSIRLTPSTLSLTSGQYYPLSITVFPSTATDSSVTWSSSNTGVAIVSSSGNVRAIGAGTAVITCTSNQNTSVQATCTVTVMDTTKVRAFVTRLYEKCLGRTPDTAGLNSWSNALIDGRSDGATTGFGFVFSQEYLNKNTSNEDYVEMLYEVFLDRASDAGGKASWVSLLEQGISREYVFKGFVESAEYSNICSSYGINRGTFATSQPRDVNFGLTSFVSRLYTKVLGRSYDVDGLNAWCGAILNGQGTPEQVAENFVNSQEFLNKNLSNEEYVKVLYRTFLNREYDPSGLNAWVTVLNQGTSRQDVLHGFSRSPEFARLMAEYGL